MRVWRHSYVTTSGQRVNAVLPTRCFDGVENVG